METVWGKLPKFSSAIILFAVLLVIGITAFSVAIANQHKTGPKQSAETIAQTAPATITPASSAATSQPPSSWDSYDDTGYTAASGINIKYPHDWKIHITGVKTVGNATNPTGGISERVVYLPTPETAQQEWNTCATAISADACGAAPGDKTVSGSESIINGLDAYSATMQGGSGMYYVTVIRGNKATSNGIPFVEFTIPSNDPAALGTFTSIMASATFPN